MVLRKPNSASRNSDLHMLSITYYLMYRLISLSIHYQYADTGVTRMAFLCD